MNLNSNPVFLLAFSLLLLACPIDEVNKLPEAETFKITSADPGVFALFTDLQYHFPTRLPDRTYRDDR